MQEVGNVEAIVKAIDDNEGSFFFVPWIGKEYTTGLFSKRVLIVGVSHYCNHTNVCFCSHDNSDCNFLKHGLCGKGCKYFLDCTTFGEKCGNTEKYDNDCKWMKRDEEHSCLYDKLCRLIKESHDIYEKLSSTTLDEVCNFLDPNCHNNKSFTTFTKYCIEYFKESLKEHSKTALWEHIAFVNYSQIFQPGSTGNKFKESDFKAFKKYIEVLEPDIVIFWGRDLEKELENQLKKEFGNKLQIKKSFGNYIWRLNTDTFLDKVDYINTYHPSSNKFRDGDKLDKAMNNVFKGLVSD